MNLTLASTIATAATGRPVRVIVRDLPGDLGRVHGDGDAGFTVTLSRRAAQDAETFVNALMHELAHILLGHVRPGGPEPRASAVTELDRARGQVQSGGGLYWRERLWAAKDDERRAGDLAERLLADIEAALAANGLPPVAQLLCSE